MKYLAKKDNRPTPIKPKATQKMSAPKLIIKDDKLSLGIFNIGEVEDGLLTLYGKIELTKISPNDLRNMADLIENYEKDIAWLNEPLTEEEMQAVRDADEDKGEDL